MKKIFSIFFSILSINAYSAGCESYPGWIASDRYVFKTPDSSSCDTGYAETTDIKVVDDTADCGTGWIATTRYKEVVCDTSRGTCSTSYVCPAP